MRRMIRWADAEGRVAVGIELDEEGHFYELVGTSDPMRLLQGESFEVQSSPSSRSTRTAWSSASG